MAGVRRVTRSILRYVFPLYVLLLILQVYFAGEGIFGARDADQTIEDAKPAQPAPRLRLDHRPAGSR